MLSSMISVDNNSNNITVFTRTSAAIKSFYISISFHTIYSIACRLDELNESTELTAGLVNDSVDLKFFPGAPTEENTRKRVCSTSGMALASLHL